MTDKQFPHVITDFTPKKIIPVAHCWTCAICRSCKVLDNLTEAEREALQYGGIHEKCPLEDYKP